MLIQFAGYDVGAKSRIYKFNVMDPPRDAREFSVEIESNASRWGTLQLQDGPSICFNRLRSELERETPELGAKSHLRIGEQDVQEYLAHQHPKKKTFGHKLELANPMNPQQTREFPAPGRLSAGYRP